MDTIKKIMFKYKIIIGILVFLIISFGIYLFVSAENDIYANQIEVSKASVSIEDGTQNNDGNFDSDDTPGNDSSINNKIVRSFDSIKYNITYNLGYKSNSTLGEKPSGIKRPVIIDVLLPKNVTAQVKEGNTSNSEGYLNKSNIKIGNVDYIYYTFEVQGDVLDSSSNKTSITIDKINMKNDSKILPIIRIREKTDESYSDYNNDSQIGNTLELSEVKVSAKDNYNVKLYNGIVKGKESGNATLPIGIAVYIPSSTNKGIKGVQIPDTLSFNISIVPNPNDSSIVGLPTIDKYIKKDGSDVIISNLPYSYENNGTVGIKAVEGESNMYTLTYSGLTYHDGVINIGTDDNQNNVNYISTNALVVNTTRNTSKSNITYTISALGLPNTDISTSNSITMLDNYTAFVGDYSTKVDFIDLKNIESSSSSEPVTTKPNSAVYNYNEEFYIQNKIDYGTIGDDLPNGLTNYLKIDNTAIKLLDVSNISEQDKDYYIEFSNQKNKPNYTLQYAVGEWNSNYFTVKSNAPSYCPTDLSKVSKEQLMNLYGGPCISENSSVKWYDSLSDAGDENEENLNKIIAVKLNITGKYETGLSTILRFKAKVQDNTSLIGNTYQVVARGMTEFNGEEFYMYDPSDKNQIPVNLSKQSADISYSKTVYNNSTLTVTQSENPTGKFGNSIIVSSAKASIKEITVLDRDGNGSSRGTYYVGSSDPLEIDVKPTIYKSDMDATIDSATIDVYLPNSLVISPQVGDKMYSSTRSDTLTENGITHNYTVYTYTYTSDDIKYDNNSPSGTIPTLKIHANIGMNTVTDSNDSGLEAKVYSRIYGTVLPGNSETSIAINTPEKFRVGETSFNIKNNNAIGTLGVSSPTYIDPNGSYTYNMKAANIAEDNAELEMLYILPFNGDGVSNTNGSTFDGTLGSSIVGTLPQGYTVYYATDKSKTILSNEITSTSSVDWHEWTNYNTSVSGITAIKVVPSSGIKKGAYFLDNNGLTVKITTTGNKEGSIYYNIFYMLHKNSLLCDDYNESEECSKSETGLKTYNSNVSTTSVYNRSISGLVFQDDDYDGFSTYDEPKLSDVIVELYKTDATVSNSKKPLDVVSDNDKKVAESVTNSRGEYKFSGLTSGNYYVKYTFDCDKYTATEKNKQDSTLGDMSESDSDAVMQAGTCSAVSNILTLNNEKVNITHIDLGLRVRQIFDVTLNKYITNVKVNSNKGTQSYDYDNAKKVKIDVKNLRNTTFQVSYLIELENTKYFPGTIGNIIETIPDGMTFNPDLPQNKGWYESDGNLYYSDLSSTLLMPGEKHYVTIVLDLSTNSGGDYINFVATSDLRVKSIVNSFVELPEDTETTIDESTEVGE